MLYDITSLNFTSRCKIQRSNQDINTSIRNTFRLSSIDCGMNIFNGLACLDGTVKLGYNDQGYYEFTFIMNKQNCAFWSQMTTYYKNFHGYNEQMLAVP